MRYFKLPALFLSPDERKAKYFYETENGIQKILGETEKLQSEYADSISREDEHLKALKDIEAANVGLQVADKSVENIALRKRLKRRKQFTVAIEALLGISAVKLFFSETINVGLPWITAMLCGLGLAYVVLNEAINYKIDDEILEVPGDDTEGKTSFKRLWNRLSWFIPLLLIPVLNIYNIMMHPGNPTNIIWAFFAGLSIWLNIKCVGYAKQFALIKKTAIAEKLVKPVKEGIKRERNVQKKIRSTMVDIKSRLMILAMDLKRLYQSASEKPTVNINPLYILLLNNRFYMHQFLPVPDIVIANPPPNMSDYINFWDEMQRIDITPKLDTSKKGPAKAKHSEVQEITDIYAESVDDQLGQGNAPGEGNPDNKKNGTAPGFDDIISDDDFV